MTDDINAISGEQGGYVPCNEVPLALTAPAQDASAAFGEDEGFVATAATALADDADATDTSAVFGRAGGFVAGPCDCTGTLTCPGVPLLTYFDIDLGTSWRPVGGVGSFTSLIRQSHVPDGSPPSGPATFTRTDGPLWENPAIVGDDLTGIVVPTWLNDGAPGWLIQERTATNHLSWLNPSSRPCVQVTGDLVVALAWTGTGEAEATLVAPAITWELCVENYDTLDVQTSAFEDPGDPAVRTLADLYLTGGGYFPTVVAAGTAGLGTYPMTFKFRNPGTTYLQLMLRISDDTAATVAVFDRAFDTPALAAYAWPRYPDYLTDNGYRTLAGSGGMLVRLDNLAIKFCT